MSREYEVHVVAGGRSIPLLVEAGEAATVGGLRTALADAVPDVPAQRFDTLYLDTTALSDDQLLVDIPLLAAARLDQHASNAHSERPGPESSKLAVVGGLSAGVTVSAPTGRELVVGRAADCDLVLAEPEVSRHHARIRIDEPGRATVADTGSRNGVGFRGVRIAGDTGLEDHDVVQVGESLLCVRPCEPADGALRQDPAAGVSWFNRPPRIAPARRTPEVTIPAKPEKPRGMRFLLATVFIPLLLAAVLYLVMPHAG
jgi:S-DNA-T family DNA segregation ATPase FtsK/SpoIIIE